MTASPPLHAPLLFADLVALLRRQGFPIGVDHHLRLYTLLDRLGDSSEPSQLKTLLCPVFATSREEQELFYAAFDLVFHGFADAPARRDSDELELQPPGSRAASKRLEPAGGSRWRVLVRRFTTAGSGRLGMYSAVLLTTIVLGLARYRFEPTRQPPAPIGAPTGPVAPAVSPDSSVRASPGPIEQTAVAPAPVAPRRTSEMPATWSAYFRFIGVFVIPLLIGIVGFEVHLYRRRRPSLRVDRWKRPPFVWQVRVPGIQNPFLRVDELRGVARTLRRRAPGATQTFDIERTINATIASLGFPTFRHQVTTKPAEYLVLIERSAFRDHQAAMFNALVAALEHEGVLVNRYYFDRDPRTCYREAGEPSVPLTELQRKHTGQHVVLLGTGDSLLDPITGLPRAWVELFEAWPDRALLTPAPIRDWGVREITLATFFVVLPATFEGLSEVRGTFDAGQRVREDSLRDYAYDGAMRFEAAPAHAETVATIRAELGEELYPWLCACAIYPELHWDLTLLLSALPQLGPKVRTEANLLRLARLPWFRAGTIPDDAREVLVRDLDPVLARDARVAIIDLLERNPPPRESVAMRDYMLQVAVQRFAIAPKNREARRELEAAIRVAPREHARRQLVFVRLQDAGARDSSTVVLPKRLRRRFMRGVWPRFELSRFRIPRFELARFVLRPAVGVALGTAIVLPIGLGLFVSLRWERKVKSAMASVAALPSAADSGSMLEALVTLDMLRVGVEVVTRGYTYGKPPWWLRFGMGRVQRLYQPSRDLYFEHFARLVYDSTRAQLREATLEIATPGSSVPYDSAYRLLRLYLTTTGDHGLRSPSEIRNELFTAWPKAGVVDTLTRELVRRQFEFFGRELMVGNPYADRRDAALVRSVRAVLARSSGITPIYMAMLAATSRRGQPVRLGTQAASAVVVNLAEVPPQFTKQGWSYFVDTALTRDLDRFLQGEPWVTGDGAKPPPNRDSLARALRVAYASDYVAAWQWYTRSANIVGFASLRDAAAKLGILSGPTSPLLGMLLTVSENVAVDSSVRAHLQPVDLMMPLANSQVWVGGANKNYMDQLGALAIAVGQVAAVPVGVDASTQLQSAMGATGEVRSAVGRLARQFAAGPERELELGSLLLAPALGVEALVQADLRTTLKAGNTRAIDDAAAAFCANVSRVLDKFPFSRSSAASATGSDLTNVFGPSGQIAQFFARSLEGRVLQRTGAGYGAIPGGPVPTSSLITFMNASQRITDALFPGGTAEPRVQFTLRPQLTESIPVLTLYFGDETFQFARGAERTVTAVWELNADASVAFSRAGMNTVQENGSWAPLRMYWNESRPGAVAGTKIYDIVGGSSRATLEMSVSGGLADPAFFSGLRCPAQAVR